MKQTIKQLEKENRELLRNCEDLKNSITELKKHIEIQQGVIVRHRDIFKLQKRIGELHYDADGLEDKIYIRKLAPQTLGDNPSCDAVKHKSHELELSCQ